MSDLVDFLQARIDDDERIARYCIDDTWRHQLWDGVFRVIDQEGEVVCVLTYDDMANQHIARWDPARVLAECEAKRRIVQRSLDIIASFGDWDARRIAGGRILWTDVNRRERAHAHDALHWLAEPYADHPDYRPEWRS